MSSIENGVVGTSWPPSNQNVSINWNDMWFGIIEGITGQIAINIANTTKNALGGIDALGLLRQWGNEQEVAAQNALNAATAAQTQAATAQQTATNVGTAVQSGATGTQTTTGNSFLDGISSSVSGVYQTATAASATAIQAQLGIQQIQTSNNGTGSSGASRQIVFSGADGAALSTTDWTTTNIVIRGSNNFAGIAAAAANNAIYLAMSTYQYQTDNQSVSMVVGDSGSQYASTSMFLRCTSTGSAGAYCSVSAVGFEMGYFTGAPGSGSYATTKFTSQSNNIAAGSLVEFRAAGNNYYVFINGTQQASFTDTGAHVTTGASNRYFGFSMFRTPPAPVSGSIFDSFRLASVAMSDIALPGASVTPSWHLSRSSTSGVSVSVGINSGAKLPSGFFSTQDFANHATVTTLDTGVVTIQTAGFYWLTCTIQTSSSYSNYSYWCVFVNDSEATQGIPSGTPFPIYLNVGDTVQPGLFAMGRTVGGSINNNMAPQDATISTTNGGRGQHFAGVLFAT